MGEHEESHTGDRLEKVREALGAGLKEASTIEQKHGATGAGIYRMAEIFKDHGMPPWLSNLDLIEADIARELPAAAAMIRYLVEHCEERAHLRPFRVEIQWWTGNKATKGKVTLGKAGPVPIRERLTWAGSGPAPWFRVQLSLPYWLLASDELRFRLLHHELGHCQIEVDDAGNAKPTGRGHDVEEFSDTMARFGLFTKDQAELIAAAMGRKDTEAVGRQFGVTIKGKQLVIPFALPSDEELRDSAERAFIHEAAGGMADFLRRKGASMTVTVNPPDGPPQ
jgi:hypothetical protein